MKVALFLTIFLLIFSPFHGFISPVYAAQTYNLATSTNYNIRFDGAGSGDKISQEGLFSADLNNDGKKDIIAAAFLANNNSRNDSGSLYIIYNTLIDDYSGTGNNIDLADSTNYNLRYDGAVASDWLTAGGIFATDLNNNGKNDLVIGAYLADNNSRSNSGSIYVIYDDLIDDYSGTGNNIDLADSSNYNLRFDGSTETSGMVPGLAADFNGNGKNDLVLFSNWADYNSRTDSGSVFVIYDDLIDDYSGTGNNIDLEDTSNYHLRFDGAAANDTLQAISDTADIDQDGRNDLVFASKYADNNSRNASGSIYVVFNSLFSQYSGTGNAIDLADTDNFNLRYDGAEAGDSLGLENSMATADFDTDGKADLFMASIFADNNSRDNSGSFYLIYDDLIDDYSGTGNTIDLADSTNYNLRYDGAEVDELVGDMGGRAVDIDGDGRQDFLTGAPDLRIEPQNGRIYVIYNTLIDDYSGSGNNIDLANSANYSLKFIGNTGGHLTCYTFNFDDLNSDGSIDFLFTAHFSDFNSRADSGSFYIIYNFPHSLSVDSVGPYTTSDSLTISGSVSVSADSVTSLSGVEYSLDSNSPSGSSWTACSGTSSFTCSLTSLAEGTHTLYLRGYDGNTSYTAQSNYGSAAFTYDSTSPIIDWTTDQGAARTFQPWQIDHLYTTDNLPHFEFTKASDALAGVSKYQILIKKEGGEYSTYLDDIDHNRSSGSILDETDRYTRYELDNVFIHSKRSQDQLANGAYRWKVKAIDKAGNSTETEEKTLLINVHTANFSGEYFPLSILNIGNRNTNITTLDETTFPSSLSITNTSPTFYGITTVNSTVSLTLKQNNQIIVAQETIANPESRFGINITTPLASGEYTAKISATNLAGDYVEIPEFTLIVGSSGTVAGETTAQPEAKPTPAPVKPSPTPIPTPTPQPGPPNLFQRLVNYLKRILNL